ncbi:MAG TPA: ATP-dependent metalloprotease, partial [Chromatiales bacterium]|nr:ATP-dependent metalloprotease [Chromatiales bacterium]
MNDLTKNILLWVIVVIILMSVFNNLSTTSRDNHISYSDFLQNVQTDQVREVSIIGGNVITGVLQNGTRFSTYSPETDNSAMIGDLMKHGVKIVAKPNEPSIWTQIFISWFPFLLIIGLWIFFMRQMQG